MEQKFGGLWTLIKLDILEAYLAYYTTVLKNQPFILRYIDVFAGSGQVTIKDLTLPIDGSARIALKYPFSEYIFIDKNPQYCEVLRHLQGEYPSKNIKVLEGDGNKLIDCVFNKKSNERGIVFLDPYAMHLKWSSLEKIAKYPIFDVWYLFPLMALNRNLKNSGQIDDSNRAAITDLLGTEEWYKYIYQESPQLSFIDVTLKEKLPLQKIEKYVIMRLETIFSKVSHNSLVLKHPENNTPLFLLCFATTNPNRTAQDLAMKGANYILKKAVDR